MRLKIKVEQGNKASKPPCPSGTRAATGHGLVRLASMRFSGYLQTTNQAIATHTPLDYCEGRLKVPEKFNVLAHIFGYIRGT